SAAPHRSRTPRAWDIDRLPALRRSIRSRNEGMPMDLTPSAFDGLKERASRLAKRFSGLRESPETLSLFHRALLRFPEGNLPSVSDRDHFYRSWYRAMRSVIADLYRAEQRRPVTDAVLDSGAGAATEGNESPDLVANEMAKIVDSALADLAAMDPVAAKIVHL